MKNLAKYFLLILLVVTPSLAQPSSAPLFVEEVDGSPSGVATKLKVPNDSITKTGTVFELAISGGNTLYTANDALTSARTVATAGFPLTFSHSTSPTLNLLETNSNANTVIKTTSSGGFIGTTSNHNMQLMHNNKTVALFNDDQIFFTASDIIVEPDGSSVIGSVGRVLLMEQPGLGRHVVGFRAPASIALNRIWELPAVDGTANQVLKTNGAEVLSWADPNIFDTMRLTPRSTPPGSPQKGDLYVDSDSNELCFYDGTAWFGLKLAGACT